MQVRSLVVRGMARCPELELIDLSGNVSISADAKLRSVIVDALECWFSSADTEALSVFWKRRFCLSDIECVADPLPEQMFWSETDLVQDWLVQRNLSIELSVSLDSAQVGWLSERINTPELRVGLMEDAQFSMKVGFLLNSSSTGVAITRSDYRFGVVPVPYERPAWLNSWLLQIRGCFSRAAVRDSQILAERLFNLSFSLGRGQRLDGLRAMLSDFGEVRAARRGTQAIVLVNEEPAETAGELFWLRLATALACFENEVSVVWLGELAQMMPPKSYSELNQQLWIADKNGHFNFTQETESSELKFPLRPE